MKKRAESGKLSSFAPAFVRGYRNNAQKADEVSFQVVVEQTDLWITVSRSNGPDLAAVALQCVNTLRSQILAWTTLHPEFGTSLVPLPVPDQGAEIIRRMSLAGRVFNVGPMAAVAGGIAALAADELRRYSPTVIVENGGDTMLHSPRERIVGLLPDPKSGAVFGVRVKAREFPVSFCASSATIGHSLSFGSGELAVVRASDAFMADAAATAFCNLLRQPDDVRKVADLAASFASEGVQGVFAQCKGRIGIWGNMELTPL